MDTTTIRGRVCAECGAFVTVLDRTEGVFCDRGAACPSPRLAPGYTPDRCATESDDAGWEQARAADPVTHEGGR